MKTLAAKTLLSLLVLSAGLILLDSQKVLETPKSMLQVATVPLQYLVYNLKSGVEDSFSFLTFWKSGEERIKNLELRIMEMVPKANRVESLERENTELRKQLGISSLAARRLLPVTILGTSRYLEIGLSDSNLVHDGQTVVYLDNLIGKIVKISGRVAFVELPTDSGAKIAAKTGMTRGLVVGEFNAKIRLSQIAANEDVRPGDVVVTSGEGGMYVPGLLIGKVGSVSDQKEGLFKEAVVEPVVDYGKLTTVFVVVE